MKIERIVRNVEPSAIEVAYWELTQRVAYNEAREAAGLPRHYPPYETVAAYFAAAAVV